VFEADVSSDHWPLPDGAIEARQTWGEIAKLRLAVIARSTLVRRSPPSGEGGCDEAIHSLLLHSLGRLAGEKWRITPSAPIRPTNCNRAEDPVVGTAMSICKLRDDAIVPLICPTCQNVFAGIAESIHAGDTMLLCMGLFSIFLMAAGTRPQPAA
jgi:hypothetical protein